MFWESVIELITHLHTLSSAFSSRFLSLSGVALKVVERGGSVEELRLAEWSLFPGLRSHQSAANSHMFTHKQSHE